MHAFCFCGGSRKQRTVEIDKFLADWSIDKHSIVSVNQTGDESGIAAVYVWKKSLSVSPSQHKHMAGIIYGADTCTVEAQNALLKILEEPPSYAYILLECQSTGSLLPTILSRVQVVRVTNLQPILSEKSPLAGQLETVCTASSLSSCIEATEQVIGTRTEILCEIESLLRQNCAEVYRNTHITIEDYKNIRIIRILFHAKKFLQSNIHIKLALENAYKNIIW